MYIYCLKLTVYYTVDSIDMFTISIYVEHRLDIYICICISDNGITH